MTPTTGPTDEPAWPAPVHDQFARPAPPTPSTVRLSPPLPPRRKSKIPRNVAIGIVAFLAFGAISSALGLGDKDKPAIAATPATTAPAPTPALAATTPAPAPATEAPVPVTEAPAPVTEAPAPVTEAPAPVTEAPAPVTTPAPAPEPAAPSDELVGWLMDNVDRIDTVSNHMTEMGKQATAMNLAGTRAEAKNLIVAIDGLDTPPRGSEAGDLIASGLAKWREAATTMTTVTLRTDPADLKNVATLLRDGTDDITEATTIILGG